MENKKTIVLTGGTGFIGSHLCQKLIDKGHKVICLSRSEERIAGLKERLKNISPDNFYFYIVDINNEEEIKKCALKIKDEHGGVDTLINNAARRSDEAGFRQINKKQWLDVLDANVVTPFFLSLVFAELMPKYGSIINIGSIYGVTSTDLRIYDEGERNFKLTGNTVYGVSKAALAHLTKYLAVAFGEKQIRVNCVSYGGVRNEQRADENFVKRYASKVPMGRMAELNDTDGIISFLISDNSQYITGENILVDGGWSLY